MMKNNPKKTDIEKQLIKFRNQFHNLLIKYPEIRVVGDIEGDVLAFVPTQEGPRTKMYLPRSGNQELITRKQELITQFALGK